MSKSRETWNKKETEKKKRKKRQDKEQRREERKAQAKEGGTSFDDMIAYVDEDGNITSTPPDPSKKREVREEDIVIGVPRQSQSESHDPIRRGTVSFFNTSKGYGFIRDHETQESIFVHANGLIDEIHENDKVTFEVQMGHKGPNAVDVKLIR
ncbi:MAG: cold shock domain-containing protein [Bacteroidota bacterium]|jgi:cold shock CspA family protein|nr:MAG: DNA-binding protein [Bacteroidota bacterium]